MKLARLKTLIAKGESETVEFKETTGQRTEACRTLCAFLNGKGGTVVFGVTRKGKLVGQEVSDETKKDLARAFCDFEPGVEVPVEYVPVDDTHQAIVCKVESGKHKPYVYDGRPYRRVQSTTTKMTQEQYSVLLARRGGFQSDWELQWNDNVTIADVDFEEVTRTAKIAVAEGRLSTEADVNDAQDLLRRFGLLKDGRPLNGAMALFGKDLTFYPHCILKLAWFKGKDKTVFLDNRMVSGNIMQLQSEAMAFCFKHLNLSGVVKGLYREEELEIPVAGLREAIINALAHRLYSSNGGVSLAIYDDRVEIANPGNFNPDFSAHRAVPGMASSPRNPSIAKVLYLRKAIEMWGRGIGLIIDACKQAHLPPPTIYEDRGFVYTVFSRPTSQEWTDKVGEGTHEENQDNATQNTVKNLGGAMKGTRAKTAPKTRVKTGPKTGLKTGLKTGPKTGLKSTAKAGNEILTTLRRKPSATIGDLMESTKLSRNGVKWHLNKLKSSGRIRRVGPAKGGHWEVVD